MSNDLRFPNKGNMPTAFQTQRHRLIAIIEYRPHMAWSVDGPFLQRVAEEAARITDEVTRNAIFTRISEAVDSHTGASMQSVWRGRRKHPRSDGQQVWPPQLYGRAWPQMIAGGGLHALDQGKT